MFTEQIVVGSEFHVSVLEVHCVTTLVRVTEIRDLQGRSSSLNIFLTLVCARHQLRYVYLDRASTTVPVVRIPTGYEPRYVVGRNNAESGLFLKIEIVPFNRVVNKFQTWETGPGPVARKNDILLLLQEDKPAEAEGERPTAQVHSANARRVEGET